MFVVARRYLTQQSCEDDDIQIRFMWISKEIHGEIDGRLIPFVNVGKFIVKCTTKKGLFIWRRVTWQDILAQAGQMAPRISAEQFSKTYLSIYMYF